MAFGIFNICFFLQNTLLLKQRDTGNLQGEPSQVGEGTPEAPSSAGAHVPLCAAPAVLVAPKMQKRGVHGAHSEKVTIRSDDPFSNNGASLRILQETGHVG